MRPRPAPDDAPGGERLSRRELLLRAGYSAAVLGLAGPAGVVTGACGYLESSYGDYADWGYSDYTDFGYGDYSDYSDSSYSDTYGDAAYGDAYSDDAYGDGYSDD